MSDKSHNYIHAYYIQYFEDLSQVHQWNWGAAALVHLQHYMDEASENGCCQMAGYMSFLQGWVISHLPRISVWSVDANYTETLPRCARYVPGQGQRDGAGYREHLDNMQLSDFDFTPYDAHRGQRPLIDACWFSGWLRSGSVKGRHLPERVLRQFGYVQGIPRDPAASAPSGLTMDQIDDAFLEEMEDRLIDEDMRGAAVVNRWDYEPGYISWYYRVSHPLMLKIPPHTDLPRPPMLEVLIEEQTRND
ncbi:serine/threonine-protein phosphatase 7 long form-like protein, partial [Trifolium medium]|nr:serine/threonine-protein phosphatase 7 long form-like protein [Trifolium medium]